MSTHGIHVNLGLGEFVVQLVRETVDSLVGAQIEQERRSQEILATATSDPASQLSIREEDIDRELLARFPEDEIVIGAKYVRADVGVAEAPAFAARLGLTLADQDSIPKLGGRVLSKTGVEHVRARIRELLAQSAQLAARRLIERGVPRVEVTAGRIVAKIALHAVELDEESSPAVERLQLDADPQANPNLPAPTRPTLLARGDAARALSDRLAEERRSLRIIAAPGEKRPAEQVWGELELTFRTVTS